MWRYVKHDKGESRMYRKWIALVLCVAGALFATVLVACGGDEGSGGGNATSTIKIGVLNPTTGAQTQNGSDVNAGLKLYFDSIGNKVGDHPVELIFEDDASNPQQGLERARKLIDQDKVDLLMGVVHSGVAVGVAEYATEREVPYIITCAGANALTARREATTCSAPPRPTRSATW